MLALGCNEPLQTGEEDITWDTVHVPEEVFVNDTIRYDEGGPFAYSDTIPPG